MTDDTPLVSILIRSMDRPTLDRALASAAAQTWPAIEIVVVAACGAAHRDLPVQIGGRPVRLIRPDPDRRLSRPDAANAALDAARGEWLNFLDDDDELLPEHVCTLLEAPRGEGVRVLYSSARVHDLDGKLIGYSGRAGYHMQLYNQNRNQPVATAFHRSLVDEGARFDPSFPVYEDHDFFINCASRSRFQWVEAATCIWNAASGDSGCGYGPNADEPLRDTYYKRLREKWAAQFQQWMNEPEALIYLAQHHLKQGDLKLAIQCLERVLVRHPDDLNALNLYGMACFHDGRIDAALDVLSYATKIAPDQPSIAANLALVEQRSGRSAASLGSA